MRRLLVGSVLIIGAVSRPVAASAPIIGGTIDAGDPAVVMLAAYPTDRSTLFTCTAVVVAPRVLLTAGHCIDHAAGYQYGVFFGADASAYPTLVALEPQLAPVSAVHLHPQYSRTAPFNADIGIVVLTSAVPSSITPLTFQRTAPAPTLAGAQVRIIGYGQTSYGHANSTRYAATTSVMALESDDTILIGDSQRHTCVGDSGGPVLLGDVILGVDSYSNTTGCTDPAYFRRTDAYVAFIDQYAGTGGTTTMPDAGVGAGDPPSDPPAEMNPDGGGCSAGGTPGALLVPFVVLGALRRRRRS